LFYNKSKNGPVLAIPESRKGGPEMFRIKKKKETKATYCDDCKSIIDTDASVGSWIKCPYCDLHFQFTKVVRRVS